MESRLRVFACLALLAVLAGCKDEPASKPDSEGVPASEPDTKGAPTAKAPDTPRPGSDGIAAVVLCPRQAAMSAALAPLMEDRGFADRVVAAAELDPRDLESVTYTLVPADSGGGDMPFGVTSVFRFSRPLDSDQWARKLVGGFPESEPEGTWPKRKDYKGRAYYLGYPGTGGPRPGQAASAVDRQTVFLATSEARLQAMLSKQREDSPLSKRLSALKGKGELVFVALPDQGRETLGSLSALVESRMTQGPRNFLASQATPMMDNSRAVTVRLDLDGENLVEAVLEGKGDQAARNIEAAVRDVLGHLKQAAEAGPAPNQSPVALARQLIDGTRLSCQGNVVTLRVPRPADFDRQLQAAVAAAMHPGRPDRPRGQPQRVRVVVETNSDWYALSFSDDVQLVDVVTPPKYLQGEKPGCRADVCGPEDRFRPPLPEDWSPGVLCVIKKPANDLSPFKAEFNVALAPALDTGTVSMRFGKGWAGDAKTWIYDAKGREVLSHVSAGPGDRFGDWNEKPLTVESSKLLPQPAGARGHAQGQD